MAMRLFEVASSAAPSKLLSVIAPLLVLAPRSPFELSTFMRPFAVLQLPAPLGAPQLHRTVAGRQVDAGGGRHHHLDVRPGAFPEGAGQDPPGLDRPCLDGDEVVFLNGAVLDEVGVLQLRADANRAGAAGMDADAAR